MILQGCLRRDDIYAAPIGSCILVFFYAERYRRKVSPDGGYSHFSTSFDIRLLIGYYSLLSVSTFCFCSKGSYEVNDDMTKANSRYATAPFKSTTFRNFLGNTNSHPGPGTYNPFDAAEKPDVKRLP